MKKAFIILTFLLLCLRNYAQFPFDPAPKSSPETLYFAYKDDVQLIVIDNYDAYIKYGTWYDAMYPRGGSWFMDHGPAPRNVYIFRDLKGKIIKIYNTDSIDENSLQSTAYINTNAFSLYSISDYGQLHHHLMYYDENNKAGLINLKGEIVVPASYDNIRKFQDRSGKGDKLIVTQDNKFGFLDSNLQVLFPPIYRTKKDTNYIGYPEHNTIDTKNLKVFKGDKCGLIAESGDVLIDFLFDEIQYIHDSMYIGFMYRNETELTHSIDNYRDRGYQVKTCFIFDKNFHVLAKLKNYEYMQYSGIRRFIVQKDNKFGVINHLGDIIVPLEYNSLYEENGVYHVSKDNKHGIITLKGKLVLPCEYENIQFYGPAVYVTQDGLIGVYNLQYQLIAKPQFESRTWDMGKFVLTRRDGSRGFVKHEKEGTYYQSPEGEIIKLSEK